ncbi:hypothetical protein Droror1_Dr00015911 [Drosera rotundifolia]
MLRRKPTKIELKLEDKEELQQLHSTTPSPSPSATSTLLDHLNKATKLQSKSQRIGYKTERKMETAYFRILILTASLEYTFLSPPISDDNCCWNKTVLLWNYVN